MQAAKEKTMRKRGRQDDAEMDEGGNPETGAQRKKIKVKRRMQTNQQEAVMEEEEEKKGSNEGDLSFEDSHEDEFEVEDIVQRPDSDEEGNDDWSDCDSDADANRKAKVAKLMKEESEGVAATETEEVAQPGQIWDEKKNPLQEGEELEYDGSAYVMLHRSKVEWPCLSIDYIVRERCTLDGFEAPANWFPSQANGQLDANAGNTVPDPSNSGALKHKKDQFPMDVYMVSGSQAEKRGDNRLYVMKWADMHKTTFEDEECSDSDEEEARNREPVIRYEAIPNRGGINRVRSMHGTPIVAAWTDEGEVAIFNVASALEELDKPIASGKCKVQQPKKYGGCKVASFKHRQEGYALDWSCSTLGRLAAGSNDASIYLYKSADETCSSFVKEFAVGLQGHKGSVEDIQWSPSQDHVLASCSSDTTIKLWDVRATQLKPVMSWVASDCDVNVISWNSAAETRFLLASGDDKGEIKIWDLRMLQPFMNAKKAEIDPITQIHWHTDAITSIQFEPRDESVLGVTSADNRMTLWDFSVEIDEAEQAMQANDQLEMQIPPQMMFLHQGQNNMKELRFHPQYSCLMVTTAEDSFNVFKPNLEPVEQQQQPSEDNMDMSQEDTKQDSSSAAEGSKQ